MDPLASQHAREVDEISFIRPHLYLSGQRGLNPESLRQLEIKHIINATLESPFIEGVPEITFKRIPIDDMPGVNIFKYFNPVADQIHLNVTDGENILVHCVAGVSRSASLVLAYLVKFENMSLRDAFVFVCSKRSIIRPNISFFEQLIRFEEEIRGQASVKIVNVVLRDGSLLPLPDIYQLPEFKRKQLLEVIIRKRQEQMRKPNPQP